MMKRTETESSHDAVGIVQPTERDWEETLAATPGVMIVDFWAPWCGPCRAIAPVLEELVRASGGTVTLAKVNVDQQPGLAARYAIHSIPTLLFVKDGRVVDQLVGAVPKAVLQSKLDALRELRHTDAETGGKIA